MGEPNLELLRFLINEFGVQTFVETGSGHGATALKAIEIFPVVHTVELSKELYAETKSKLRGRAFCHHGKSVDVLDEILPGIDGPAAYWLDAHWSGGPTAGVDEQCPLLGELDAINRRKGNRDFLLIDDAHVFFSPAALKPPHILDHWPGLMGIFARLDQKPRYTVILASWRCAKHGHPGGIVMPEDVIVSVPAHAAESLRDWLTGLELEH